MLDNNFKASHHLKLDMGQLKSGIEAKKRQLPSTEDHNSLKEEILQLQKQLKDQVVVRCELERASSYERALHESTDENSIAKPAKDLIKEISILEMEVIYLEKYLLSLYRKTFDKRVSSMPTMGEISKPDSATQEGTLLEVPGYENLVTRSCTLPRDSKANPSKECSGSLGGQELVDSSIHRSLSSLSHCSAYSFRTPPLGALAEAVHSHHSLPLSMLERGQGASSSVSLAEHLDNSMSDHVPETPNWLSEEMIKCISAIYCQLADPPVFNHGFASSPISFSSSTSGSPSRSQYDIGSPRCGDYSSSNSWLNHPFHTEGSNEFSGSYSTMVEVQGIFRDDSKLKGVEDRIQDFRSLVSRLEEVDPRKMKREEKLAFWINVHNALVMHALLVYGIPEGNMKRFSLLLKAAYNIGGRTISVDLIQSSILGCRLPRPGQWFQSLLFPKAKFKAGDARRAYAVEIPQPLLHFALCSGSHSDPMVRMYTAKRVFQELEMAKEEYMQSTFRLHKEHKILLPKIVDSYARESDFCPAGLVEMIEHLFPAYIRKSFQQGKLGKKIDWIPHNFNFRYLFARELVK
ncbi:hypothetical protein RJ639_044996 [Escallonia herrerae]|uniref:DUF547 domain-containing protein n=1 Tax=Escallonia herrerae TaxID=1293975 RepID=A0AA88WA97_9ASTE|nr:hypothetical protein RJ639_044996 [Escallonia herrerae]